jgi:pyruvate, water dikinase
MTIIGAVSKESDRGFRYVRWFESIGIGDVALVGGKSASLGEMYRALAPLGVKVPNGFAITVDAYRALMDESRVGQRVSSLLASLDRTNVQMLAERGAQARHLVYHAGLPPDVESEILQAYDALRCEYGADTSVAVRSSATAEDLPTASFAGQHDSFLNIRDAESLLDACRRCFASLYTDRAIAYRADHGFDHLQVALSIAVMKMARSDLAASGVMFTLDTESGFRDVVFITGAYGLGENVVQGIVDPDEFYVHKPTFLQGKRAVLRRSLGKKQQKLVYAHPRASVSTRNVHTPQHERARFCLSDDDVLRLADYAIKIEKHYSERAGRSVPMDIEWAKDGIDGDLYILQARPETVVSQRRSSTVEEYALAGTSDVLVVGRSVGMKIAAGRARVITSPSQLSAFEPGDVLITDSTSPDWEPVMKTATAIVTNRGGRTCHAAIVARELGIPAVIGAVGATQKIQTGAVVTVSCAEGDTGKVYRGRVPFNVHRVDVGQLPRPKTKIMLNLGNPAIAFKTSQLPNDGVGLARMEFIVNEHIKAHPVALLHPDRVKSVRERRAIRALTSGYASGAEFFVERLSEGVGTIAAAFYPKPVVVRLSDFKSNEYAQLLGGRNFEPREENPMIGFRGAARYAHPAYAEAFALECAAIRRVRDTMGLANVVVMVPFVRRISEADRVLAKMAEFGLARGANGLKIYAMCEVPNNAILADAFAKRFDGFSIGSNDLTQLTLGVDRDSEIVAFDYDERDDGVKQMIALAVSSCRRNGIYSGLCGQAPSDYPEMAEFLVRIGIDSISLNPDVVLKTTAEIWCWERQLGAEGQAGAATGG